MNDLTLLLILPLIGAVTITVLPSEQTKLIRNLALLASLAALLQSWNLLFTFDSSSALLQFSELTTWNTRLGTSYALGVDGISLPMILLATLLCFVAIMASSGITKHVKAYYFLILLLETAMLGVFMAQDWTLFYLFWELNLIPLFSLSTAGVVRVVILLHLIL